MLQRMFYRGWRKWCNMMPKGGSSQMGAKLFFFSTEVIYGCLACAGRLSRSKLISWSLPWKVAGPGFREKYGKGWVLFLAAHRSKVQHSLLEVWKIQVEHLSRWRGRQRCFWRWFQECWTRDKMICCLHYRRLRKQTWIYMTCFFCFCDWFLTFSTHLTSQLHCEDTARPRI